MTAGRADALRPTPDTLEGERLEIYPFLGSDLLGEAVDRTAPTWCSTATPIVAGRRG